MFLMWTPTEIINIYRNRYMFCSLLLALRRNIAVQTANVTSRASSHKLSVVQSVDHMIPTQCCLSYLTMKPQEFLMTGKPVMSDPPPPTCAFHRSMTCLFAHILNVTDILIAVC